MTSAAFCSPSVMVRGIVLVASKFLCSASLHCEITDSATKSLAYFEMRLTLARLLFNFDIEPTPAIEGWTDQKIYLVWQKKPLFVKLVPRDVESAPGVVKLASATA